MNHIHMISRCLGSMTRSTTLALAMLLLLSVSVSLPAIAKTTDAANDVAKMTAAEDDPDASDASNTKDAGASDNAKGDKDDKGEAQTMLVDDQAVNLRPMFKVGRTSRYSFWSQRDRTVDVQFNGNQQSTAVRMNFEGEVTWDVKSVNPDGSATCVMTYVFVVATIKTPDEPEKVEDSRQGPGENEQIHRFLQAMAGAPIEVQVAADGMANSVSGDQLILQRLGEELKAMAPAQEEHLESATELGTLPGAPEKLAVGSDWTKTYDWKHELGRKKMTMTYRLAQVEAIAGIPVATINTSANMVVDPDYSKIPADGPKVNIRQTKGEYQGQIIFDLQRHDTVGSNTLTNTGFDITITLPNNQTIVRQISEKNQSQMLRIEEVD